MRPGRDAQDEGTGGEERLVRAAAIRAYDRRDALTLLGVDGVARRLDGDSAALARAVLAFVTTPRTRGEIAAHVAALAGVAVEEVPPSVGELIDVLRGAGAIVPPAPTPAPTPTPIPAPTPRIGCRVVLGVTGAVAACDAPQLARMLLARGHEVRAALTRAARRFVAPGALRAITQARVYTSMWQSDVDCPVPHVSLAEWADVVVVAPASARTIARLASGDFGDLVAAIALGTRAPVLVAPSMNDAMLAAPSVARNLDRLREDGFAIAHPAMGIEVAHAPSARTPMRGPAPPAGAIADLVDRLLAETASTRAPTAAEWERAWATTPADSHPWHSETLDADLAAAIDRAAAASAGRRLIDLGAGSGAAAREAARRGFEVVAIDVAPSAIAEASRRSNELRVTWIVDDVTSGRVWGQFDVLLDRGLLHVLPPARRRAYAETVGRLAAPGAWLIVKTHAIEEGPSHRTTPPSEEELRALLSGTFELVSSTPSTFPGPHDAPRAVLHVLRRR
jgi:3-polyprenyl-4-hydroxybenzoate decarboxylase/predicted nicotinamide N-methyase